MTGSIIFINLAGAVALLLWSTRMVRTGVERAYGHVLRTKMKTALRNRFSAAIAGFLFAVALQSATAVSLIVAGFVASGYVSPAIGIASLLGADFGSSFVVRLLRHDLSMLVPILLLIGTLCFRASETRNWRQLGRIFFGLGLLLLSLRLIGEASEPLKESALLPVVINYLSKDWITAFLLAALLAWGFHSSVASVLLFASLADRGLVTPELVIPLVLGVNFGGAVIGAVLTRKEDPAARVVPLGNVAIRGLGMIIALGLELIFRLPPDLFAAHPGDAAVIVHMLANVAVLIAGLPFVGSLSALLAQFLAPVSTPSSAETLVRRSALNPEDLDAPHQALANATRELVSLCDKIDLMLVGSLDVFRKADDASMARIEALDDEIDHMHREIKFYLARLSQSALDEKSAAQCQDLLSDTIKLEQAADIISQNMLTRARKKQMRQIDFSQDGWGELDEMHREVVRNARLSFNLLINPDLSHARQLVAQKEHARTLVKISEERHLQRLRDGNPASYDSSSMHMDTIRDLKEINALVVSIAYPVLEEAGMLRQSRLL